MPVTAMWRGSAHLQVARRPAALRGPSPALWLVSELDQDAGKGPHHAVDRVAEILKQRRRRVRRGLFEGVFERADAPAGLVQDGRIDAHGTAMGRREPFSLA